MTDNDEGKSLHDKRHTARVLAVQYLYTQSKEKSLNPSYFEPASLLPVLGEEKFNQKLYESIVNGVLVDASKIDKIVSSYAPEWPVDDLKPINLIILRIAIWEGFIAKKAPIRVAINEAIELAKELSDEEDAKFINGVLGKMAEELK